ncbi:DUF488 family protein [Lentibacillus cibarius]|uniref:DUF488 family protein n=1 Tax=Lentibacillus cibarius TaxID=2583219 RepID=A0A549YG19_9BACI|nr:DUF488 family protein [Lentibacillus cibarius]TRM10833.1 DUF488 family protein [Lentibacillus cibarius]
MVIKTKRIYEAVDREDGVRVLVDRVWPRGVSKDAAQLDYWLKEVGPSSELRKWFAHDPDKYEEFKQKYKEELENGKQQEALQQLKELTKDNHKQLTLLFAAKDETYNQANVLKEILDRQ